MASTFTVRAILIEESHTVHAVEAGLGRARVLGFRNAAGVWAFSVSGYQGPAVDSFELAVAHAVRRAVAS